MNFWLFVKLPSWKVDPPSPSRTWQQTFHFILFLLFIYLTAPGLHFCTCALSGCGEHGYSLVAVCGLFITVASLSKSAGCRAWASVVLPVGSVVSALVLSGPAICGIFLDQGLKQRPLHCKNLNLWTTREALTSFLMTLHYCFLSFFFNAGVKEGNEYITSKGHFFYCSWERSFSYIYGYFMN